MIGFDDAPFERHHRGDVMIIGAYYAGNRLDGILSGKVRRDGANSTSTLTRLIAGSRFYPQLQAILLQGIAFAGFNIVDIHGLHEALDRPVVVVARRLPNLEKSATLCSVMFRADDGSGGSSSGQDRWNRSPGFTYSVPVCRYRKRKR